MEKPAEHTLLYHLWKRGRAFLGVELPILCGAMTWISECQLVSSVSNAGAFGCLAAGNMEPKRFQDEIQTTKKLTNKPFAVNLITIAPNSKLISNSLKRRIYLKRGRIDRIVEGESRTIPHDKKAG